MATLTENNVAQYLRENPEFMASWFTEHADDNTLQTLARKLKQDAIQNHRSRTTSPVQRQESLPKDNNNSLLSPEIKTVLPSQSKRFLSPDILENTDLQKYSAFSRVGRNSITSLIFRKYLDGDRARRASVKKDIDDLRRMSEEELLMELIRDIASELDVTVLCHKILQNVSILTNSDRGSLFLVRGSRDSKYLVSKLFDVTESSTLEQSIHTEANEITVPFGVGIAGHVANTRESINIRDVYADPRFNQEVDKKTGYRTHSILSMPILNYEGEVIGVAQIINKISGNHEFTKQDEALFEKYLTFCGIGITNAQLFEMSLNEYKRNQLLLHLARGIFEEQSNLEKLVQKIMLDAKDLLACEKCSIFLLEDSFERDPSNPPQSESKTTSPMPVKETKPLPEKPEDVIFSKAFELRDGAINVPSSMEIAESKNAHIARCTVVSGVTLNVHDLEKDGRFGTGPFTDENGFQTKSVLCMPIHNSDHVIIGVTQLLNKVSGEPFNENDEQIIEAFSIFTGLGIHNCQMYEHACQLMAKQSVALEVLSYHATAGKDESGKFQGDNIQTSEDYRLYAYDFDDTLMTDDDTIKATIRMFIDANLINKFKVPYETMCRWVCTVKKNYRPVTYHNWRHAFNVCQTMFTMLYTGELTPLFDKVEIFALMVACLCHDLDHRGTNNAFQKKVASPLAMLYSTSVLEHHHFDHCIMILNSEGNNIFQSFSPEEYRRAITILEHAILSTDLALYFKKRGDFKKLVDNGEKQFRDPYKKELLQAMMMTACDVAAITKPWKIQKEIAQLVTAEFFEQGDIEKTQLGEKPIPMMDREKKDELPRMQVEFIDMICTPVYEAFSNTWPRLSPFYDGVMNNRHHWTLMQQGTTDINSAFAIASAAPKQLSSINEKNSSARKSNCNSSDKESRKIKGSPTSLQSRHPKPPSISKKPSAIKDGGSMRGQKEPKKPMLSPIKHNNVKALTVYAASLRIPPGSVEKTTTDTKRLFSKINSNLRPLEDGCSNNRDHWNHLSQEPSNTRQDIVKKDEDQKIPVGVSETNKSQKTESNGHVSKSKQTSIEEISSTNGMNSEGKQTIAHHPKPKPTESKRNGNKVKSAQSCDSKKSTKSSKSNFCNLS